MLQSCDPPPSAEQQEQSCAACGARSRSYRVPSCEACRQFFRRSIVNQKLWVCFQGRNCAIEKGESCRSCRFDRCLVAGMDWRLMRIPVRLSANYVARLEERKLEIMRRMGALIPFSSNSASGDNEAKLFEYLLHLEARQRRIRTSFGDLPANFISKFGSFEELFTRNDNILALSSTFRLSPPPLLTGAEKAAILEELHSVPFFDSKCIQAILVDLLLHFGIAKALPAFERLSLEDQVILSRNISIPLDIFYNCYHSAKMGSHTATRSDGFKFADYFRLSKYQGDERLAKLVERNFSRPVEVFLRTPISREEFILCVAIMHSHSAIPELSAVGRELLYAESVRYSGMLLHFLQSKYGSAQGVARYANCLHLVGCAFGGVHLYEQFVIYLEAFYLRKSIAEVFPDYLRNII